MDELNAHQFWGISPAVDLLAVASKGAPREGSGPARILQVRCNLRLYAQQGYKNWEGFTSPAQRASTISAWPRHTRSFSTFSPFIALQVTPYDSRHTLYTMCRMGRHSQEQVQLFVYEEEAEALARHMLLVSVLLDGTLLAKERMETFLELHCNVLLREKTAKYLGGCCSRQSMGACLLGVLVQEVSCMCASCRRAGALLGTPGSLSHPGGLHALSASAAFVVSAEERGRALEQMLVALSSKGELPTAQSSNSSSKSGADAAAGAGASEPMGDNGIGLLASLLDISMLKFQDRDAIVEALQKYRQSVAYDMVKAWDARSRKWYGDRFDFRRNMVRAGCAWVAVHVSSLLCAGHAHALCGQGRAGTAMDAFLPNPCLLTLFHLLSMSQPAASSADRLGLPHAPGAGWDTWAGPTKWQHHSLPPLQVR